MRITLFFSRVLGQDLLGDEQISLSDIGVGQIIASYKMSNLVRFRKNI